MIGTSVMIEFMTFSRLLFTQKHFNIGVHRVLNMALEYKDWNNFKLRNHLTCGKVLFCKFRNIFEKAFFRTPSGNNFVYQLFKDVLKSRLSEKYRKVAIFIKNFVVAVSRKFCEIFGATIFQNTRGSNAKTENMYNRMKQDLFHLKHIRNGSQKFCPIIMK